MPRIMIKGGVWRNTEVRNKYYVFVFKVMHTLFESNFEVLICIP